MILPRNKLMVGDSQDVLKTLPTESVDCCMTSIPYWGPRVYATEPIVFPVLDEGDCDHVFSLPVRLARGAKLPNDEKFTYYCEKCHAWRGHLGLEPSIDEYIAHVNVIFDEVHRILKPEGSLWLNVGDVYVDGDLACVPERLVMAMKARGWILRQKIIWNKAAPFPHPVKTRFTSAWEYVYLLVKQKDYFFQQQFEAFDSKAKGQPFGGNHKPGRMNPTYSGRAYSNAHLVGRNMRDVWRLPGGNAGGSHSAAYSEELCRIPILAGTPEGFCSACGKPRVEEIEVKGRTGKSWHDHKADLSQGPRIEKGRINRRDYKRISRGLSDCGCGAPFTPAVVLDPFMGTGTTAVAAEVLNRDWIGIELSEEYAKDAMKNIRARVASVRAKWASPNRKHMGTIDSYLEDDPDDRGPE